MLAWPLSPQCSALTCRPLDLMNPSHLSSPSRIPLSRLPDSARLLSPRPGPCISSAPTPRAPLPAAWTGRPRFPDGSAPPLPCCIARSAAAAPRPGRTCRPGSKRQPVGASSSPGPRPRPASTGPWPDASAACAPWGPASAARGPAPWPAGRGRCPSAHGWEAGVGALGPPSPARPLAAHPASRPTSACAIAMKVPSAASTLALSLVASRQRLCSSRSWVWPQSERG